MKIKQKHLKYMVFILIIIGMWFISKSFQENYSLLKTYNWSIPQKALTIGMILYLIRLFLRSLVFVSLLNNELIKQHGFNKIIFSYSLSQIVKYIPGKIFGIMSQSLHLTGTMITKSIWNAHALHYLYVIYNSGVVLVSLFFAYYSQCFIISLLVIPSAFSTYLLIKHHYISHLFNYCINIFNKKIKLVECEVPVWKVVFLLNFEWLFFFASWLFLVPEDYTFIQAIGFAVAYEFAALLGAIIFILPSGIIIREALFILIGLLLGYDKETLIVYSVLIRLFYTVADLLFGLVCYLNFMISNKENKAIEK